MYRTKTHLRNNWKDMEDQNKAKPNLPPCTASSQVIKQKTKIQFLHLPIMTNERQNQQSRSCKPAGNPRNITMPQNESTKCDNHDSRQSMFSSETARATSPESKETLEWTPAWMPHNSSILSRTRINRAKLDRACRDESNGDCDYLHCQNTKEIGQMWTIFEGKEVVELKMRRSVDWRREGIETERDCGALTMERIKKGKANEDLSLFLSPSFLSLNLSSSGSTV